ncbi:MAG: putative lipid II flippase FtsW [Planococcaceae bacterium]|nr:putative lipid II flippase FtsW [Planococcaceae bacterium]
MPILQVKPIKTFLILSIVLTAIGLSFVYSAGSYWGKVHYEDSMPFFWKQAIYGFLGIFAAWILYKNPMTSKPTFWKVMYVLAVVLLFAVYIPGLGVVRNGSRSWIQLAGFSIQPAEFVKIAVITYLSTLLATSAHLKMKWKLSHLLICLVPAGIILIQPDFGSAFLLIIGAFALLFIAGYPMKFFMVIGVSGILSIVALIISAPYRLKRIEAFINPWEDPLGSGFQGIQSLLAIGPSGLFGHGYGQSRQKFLYLPEPQNDFIFSIIVEEMGFIGAVVLIGLFFMFLYTGYRLAVLSSSTMGSLVIAGFISMMGSQIFLNIGVVIGLFPVTGVTLPFISYGGTSLFSTWLIVGIILHFSKDQSK